MALIVFHMPRMPPCSAQKRCSVISAILQTPGESFQYPCASENFDTCSKYFLRAMDTSSINFSILFITGNFLLVRYQQRRRNKKVPQCGTSIIHNHHNTYCTTSLVVKFHVSLKILITYIPGFAEGGNVRFCVAEPPACSIVFVSTC